ncbi:chaplin [Streptomyces sp. CRN 30]|uniref:chaplin n=1 Tax=Streptomyces sp. CRN 30 TaxID=3075613 RepID=UPI002A81376D|nr:chaplin [Streptomyces sp. CRN 30]
MRQVTRRGLMTVAAATGVIAASGGYANADSGAHDSTTHSPGVLTGNSVQAPVYAPVDVCGNTVTVAGTLDPAVGNRCGDQGGGGREENGPGGHRTEPRTTETEGHAADSSGIGSGNHVQAPVYAPVDVCGNSVEVAATGTPAPGGAECGTGHGGGRGAAPGIAAGFEATGGPGGSGLSGARDDASPFGGPVGRDEHGGPGEPGALFPAGTRGSLLAGQDTTSTQDVAQLARTGAELPLGLVLPAGAGALLGGALLYRKARAAG